MVIISAAQVTCLSVSASVMVSQSKGLIRASLHYTLIHIQGPDWLVRWRPCWRGLSWWVWPVCVLFLSQQLLQVFWGGWGHFLLEKRDFLLQFVSFPQREAVELCDRHPEQLLELLRGQMPLRGGGGGGRARVRNHLIQHLNTWPQHHLTTASPVHSITWRH